MRFSVFFICLGLAACGPRASLMVQGNPTATAALLALPDAQFFAQTQLAAKVANACPELGFNQRFNAALIAQRYGGNSAGLVQTANSRAVDLELDVATRSLQARYEVDLTETNLCTVGLGELMREAPLAAVLLPI